jgi:uncharacterized protein YuzE
MEAINFHLAGHKATRFVTDSLVVDYDDDQSIVGIEIVGYSCISGRPLAEADFAWLKHQVISLGCDSESDVLSLNIRFGNNVGQKKLMASFGFDVDGRLLSLSISPP